MKMAYPYFIVSVLLLAFFVQDGEPVRCWTCSSELNPQCHDPINQDSTNDNSEAYRLENCDANSGATYPYLSTAKSACMKEIKYVNNQKVTIRRCTWKRQDDFSTTCPKSNYSINVISTFCETCEYDGCNSV